MRAKIVCDPTSIGSLPTLTTSYPPPPPHPPSPHPPSPHLIPQAIRRHQQNLPHVTFYHPPSSLTESSGEGEVEKEVLEKDPGESHWLVQLLESGGEEPPGMNVGRMCIQPS